MRRLLALLLLFSAAAHADFLLWIEKPKARTNPYDLNSPLHQPTPSGLLSATVTPTRTVTASGGFTGTPTSTLTPTATRTASPTATRTASPTATRTASPTATPSHTPSASPTGTPTPMITDFGFTWQAYATGTNLLTVTAGTTVTWGWAGFHDVTSDSGAFGPSATGNNLTFAYTFNTPGTYPYHCSIHGGVGTAMYGVIYVLGVGSPTATPTASPSASPTFTRTLTPSPTASATATQVLTATATPTPASCSATYSFESGLMGWHATTYDSGVSSVAAGSAQAQCGVGSVQASLNLVQTAAPAPGGGSQVRGSVEYSYGSPADLTCKIITAWVWVPAGMSDSTNPSGAMIYVQKGAPTYAFHAAAWTNLPDTGGWTQLTYDLTTVGGDESAITNIGVQVSLGGSSPSWSGSIYVDEFNLANKGGCTLPSPTVTPTPASCPALFSFESTAEGWVIDGSAPGGVSVAQSTAQADCGTGSLAINVALTAANSIGTAQIDSPGITSNGCKIITARIYAPAGMSGDASGAQFFALTGAGWDWHASWTNLPDAGGWVTMTLDLSAVPAGDAVNRLGVQVNLGGPPPGPDYTGTLYLDKVEVTDGPSCGYSPTPTPVATLTPTPGGCAADYNFESGLEGWVLDGTAAGGVSAAQSTAMADCGTGSLALGVALTATNSLATVQIDSPAIPTTGCKLVTARVYVPAGMSGDATGAQFFALYGAAWTWTANWTNLPNTGGWVDVQLDLSAVPVGDSINRIGIQINLGGPPPGPDYTGTVYIDKIVVSDKPGCGGTPTPTATVTPGAACVPGSGPVADEKAWWLDMPPGTAIWSTFFSSSSVAPHNGLGNNHLDVNATWSGWFSNGGLRFPGWVTPPDPLLIDVTQYDNFEFWIRAAGATENSCSDINLTLLDHAGAASGSGVNLVAGGYVTMPLSTTYQKVTIPLCAFDFSGMDTSSIASLVVGIQGNAPTGTIHFYVDEGYFRKY